MFAKPIAMLIILLYNVKICQSVRYDNYTLFVTTPFDISQVGFLQTLEHENTDGDIIFWRKAKKLHEEVHVIISPAKKKRVLERAKEFELKMRVRLENVQSAFNNQYIKAYLRQKPQTYSWKYYHSLEDIYQWLSDVNIRHPEVTRIIPIGKSAEGRQLIVFAIKTPGIKHKVIVEGGIHGNEWVAIEFVTFLINILIGEGRKKHVELHKMARKYAWYLIPVVNPDGFVHSQVDDRLWRKNRRYTKMAFGVDLNRNFDYKFGKFDSSDNPLSDYYCGNHSFSEPETVALSNFIQSQHINLKFYFSIHAYGQKLIIPYSDRINHLENFGEMENFGKQAVLKMYQLHGKEYGVGTTYDTLGIRVSGNSASWVKKTYGVRYVFTFLLRDSGQHGYALPASEILPTCEEATVGLTEIMNAKVRRVQLNLFTPTSRALELQGTHLILFCIFFIILHLQ